MVPTQRESRHHLSICAISSMSAARSALTSPLVGDWDFFATRSPRLILGVDLDVILYTPVLLLIYAAMVRSFGTKYFEVYPCLPEQFSVHGVDMCR